jgi:hypothetical protein
MCLSKWANFEVANEGIGYKVFDRFRGEQLCGPYTHEGIVPYVIGNEYRSSSIDNAWYEDFSQKYRLGFHIFLRLQDAIEYIGDGFTQCVYEVSYRNILAKGIQYDSNCITTEFMTINKEVYRDDDYEETYYIEEDYDDWDDDDEDYDEDDEDYDDYMDDWDDDDDDWDEEVEE